MKPTIQRLATAAVLTAALLLTGCQGDPCGNSKETYLQNFETLMTEVKDRDLPLNDPAWDRYDERFRALVEECYDQHEAELSGGEKRRFWLRALGYYRTRFGEGAAREWLGRLGKKKEVE